MSVSALAVVRRDDPLEPGDEPLPRPKRQRRRAKEDQGLPSDKDLTKLVHFYLVRARRLWPDIAKAGLLPKSTETVVAEMDAGFKERHRSGNLNPGCLDRYLSLGLGLAADYPRYSDENSDPKSIPDQLRLALERAKQDGNFIPWELIFADCARSATHGYVLLQWGRGWSAAERIRASVGKNMTVLGFNGAAAGQPRKGLGLGLYPLLRLGVNTEVILPLLLNEFGNVVTSNRPLEKRFRNLSISAGRRERCGRAIRRTLAMPQSGSQKIDMATSNHIEAVLAQLARGPAWVRQLIYEVPRELRKRRPAPGVWSAHEHAVHLAAIYPRVIARLEQMLNHPELPIQDYEPSRDDPDDALLALDLDAEMDRIDRERAALLERIQRLTPDQWAITVEHTGYSHYGVFIMFRHLALHDHYHAYRIEDRLLRNDWE